MIGAGSKEVKKVCCLFSFNVIMLSAEEKVWGKRLHFR